MDDDGVSQSSRGTGFLQRETHRHHATDGRNGLPVDRLVGVRHFDTPQNSTATAASGMESATRIGVSGHSKPASKGRNWRWAGRIFCFVKLVKAN